MHGISPALRGEIQRSFGSTKDMMRALQNARSRTNGLVHLLAMRDGSLQIVSGRTVRGSYVLYSTAELWNTALLSARYRTHMARRPPYPLD